MRVLTDATYEQDVLKSEKDLVVVEFYTPSCRDCKIQQVQLEKVDYPEIEVLKCDVSVERGLVDELSIMSVPRLIFFQNGEVVYDKTREFHSLDRLQAEIEKLLP